MPSRNLPQSTCGGFAPSQGGVMREYLGNLQNNICAQLGSIDNTKFITDKHEQNGIVGITKVLRGGSVFEQAGVNFSYVSQDSLPKAASTKYPELAGAKFVAMGVSVVIHPNNPYIPTAHANVRLFKAYPEGKEPVWWFGGGCDLTPVYPFLEDCVAWHKSVADLCKPFGENVYQDFKTQCDKYFYLKHRAETRGVGGLFFDDLNCWDFKTCFKFMQAVGDGFLEAYLPIVAKRKDLQYGDKERAFQLYRRGRYVEFNLLYDRGTLFGLQAGGRTESILMSLPPAANWRYNYIPELDSKEAELAGYLRPREWL